MADITGKAGDRPSRPQPPTRNGEPLRVYEEPMSSGQEMNEGGTKMYGSRPPAE